jgi:hypothetical protein
MARIQPLDDAPLSVKEAFEKHVADYKTRITNMKATLGHSLLAFNVYMQWYPLYEELKKIVGERLACLFAYSVSYAADCPLCTTFFRKIIIDAGEQPENFQVNETEQHLLNFGSAIAMNKGLVTDEIFDTIKKLYNDAEIVTIVAFAGQMIATNIFNNVIETDIDEYLKDYLPEVQKNYE